MREGYAYASKRYASKITGVCAAHTVRNSGISNGIPGEELNHITITIIAYGHVKVIREHEQEVRKNHGIYLFSIELVN